MYCIYEGEYIGICCFFLVLDSIGDVFRYFVISIVYESGIV